MTSNASDRSGSPQIVDLSEFENKRFRASYLSRHLKMFLAAQIRALRGERSQEAFGELIGKPQSVVSRLERQSYGRVNLQTLIDIANKLDIGLLVRFVNFETFLKVTSDLSEEALKPSSFPELTETIPEQLQQAYPVVISEPYPGINASANVHPFVHFEGGIGVNIGSANISWNSLQSNLLIGGTVVSTTANMELRRQLEAARAENHKLRYRIETLEILNRHLTEQLSSQHEEFPLFSMQPQFDEDEHEVD